ncbi:MULTISPECIES: DUF3280 domain-containing protein [unclassified Xanthobacter]|uniref:DUF3280 domain-containing protein n=2 Tax=Xanthobacter TaxID=279 RepID=UPI001F38C343|nr:MULTISPECIES: DUF3280 domain-containing protein [unclassified Xanthobacter]
MFPSCRRALDCDTLRRVQVDMMKSSTLLAATALFLLLPAAASAAAVKTAMFGFEFFDDTLDKRPQVLAEQAERLRLVNAELQALLAKSGDMTFVDLTPEAARIADLQPFFKCNGCERDIARDAGAKLEVVGVIRKISSLILSFVLEVRETGEDGRVVRAGQVDIRGNTDESWLHGVRYLVKNRILAPGQVPLAP